MVSILISTYNGSKYLNEQIESLLAQTEKNIRILVRDDGSKDSTPALLDEYKESNLLEWYTGKNLRPARSFWNLIKKAPSSEFYALCDQDDYWHPDKVSTAIEMLSKYNGEPALYFSQTSLVDANLNPIETPIISPKRTIEEALIAHYATGCTFVFNKKLMDVLRSYEPEYLSMHDNWIYRVCLVVGGKIIFDPTSHISYRQHSNNVIGLNHSRSQVIKRKLKSLFGSTHERSRIAKELIKGYGQMMNQDIFDLVSNAATCDKSFKSRVKLIINKDISCASMKCNISSRLAILLGIY